MRVTRRLARRTVLAVFSIYVVMTIVFGFVALTADPNIGAVRWGAALEYRHAPPEERLDLIKQQVQAYRSARNLDVPVEKRYIRWLIDITTLDWGISHSHNRPVFSVISKRLPYTAVYVVPAMVLSSVIGIAAGVLTALRQGSLLDRFGTTVAYVGLGIPNFWLASVLLLELTHKRDWLSAAVNPSLGAFAPTNMEAAVLPMIVLTSSLLAGQLRYARAESLEYVGEEFVRLVKAKGLPGRGIARHILRVAAAPLLSLFFVELLAVLIVNIYVLEFVFDLPGFGLLSYEAIQRRDLPLLLGTTMVVAFIGIAANLLQDGLYTVLDPRVGSREE